MCNAKFKLFCCVIVGAVSCVYGNDESAAIGVPQEKFASMFWLNVVAKAARGKIDRIKDPSLKACMVADCSAIHARYSADRLSDVTLALSTAHRSYENLHKAVMAAQLQETLNMVAVREQYHRRRNL